MAARRLSWRTFWARRAPWRIHLVQVLLFVAALIVAYRLIPAAWQSQLNQGLLAVVQSIASLNPETLFFGLAGLLVLVCLILIFTRPYRRARYFGVSPNAVPMISVYIDAENQLPEYAIQGFTSFLMKYLDGRRADLLYFLDASKTATSSKYKTLYRFGFRPIDVPHDPTGTVSVKEAVDKELSMHAYERALVGPPKQEFIIVTGDQDFVALVYRLAALGHRVQVWASPIRQAYRTLQTYLDIDLIDLSRVVEEMRSSAQEGTAASEVATPTQAKTADAPTARQSAVAGRRSSAVPAPRLLPEAGEQQIIRTIVRTLKVREDCEGKFTNQAKRINAFRGMLGGELAPSLAGIGYSAPSKIDYWIDHLTAAGALSLAGNQAGAFPARGSVTPEQAAHALVTVARLAAKSALELERRHSGQPFSTSDIANELLTHHAGDQGAVRNLLNLVARNNPKRSTHARYFVWMAQALGVIEFEDAPNSLDLIRRPRLLESPLANDADESEQPEAEPVAGDTADTGTDADVVAETDPPAATDTNDPDTQEPEAPPDPAP